MKRISILIWAVIYLLSSSKSYCQKIDSVYLSKLKNKDALFYKTPDGKYLGCDMSLECRTMAVIIYDIEFKRELSTLTIKGRVLESAFRSDSVGIAAINIYLAQPNKNKLKKIRNLESSALGSLRDSANRYFPKRTGDFAIETSFSENDRLYFEGSIYFPLEFNIGKLLKKRD